MGKRLSSKSSVVFFDADECFLVKKKKSRSSTAAHDGKETEVKANSFAQSLSTERIFLADKAPNIELNYILPGESTRYETLRTC